MGQIVGSQQAVQTAQAATGQDPYDGAGPAHHSGGRGLVEAHDMAQEYRLSLGSWKPGDQGLGSRHGQSFC